MPHRVAGRCRAPIGRSSASGVTGWTRTDEYTDEPTFVLVNTGLFGTKSSFVPVEGARMDGDDLRLAYSKDKTKDAPKRRTAHNSSA
jgi:hypothetical protein